MEDFNEITCLDEKWGGKQRPIRQIKQSCDNIESNGLVDLGWKVQQFTWSNGHSNDSFTKERLNRALANKDWLSLFGGEVVETPTSR